jgi:hypothetical protein
MCGDESNGRGVPPMRWIGTKRRVVGIESDGEASVSVGMEKPPRTDFPKSSTDFAQSTLTTHDSGDGDQFLSMP